MSALGLNIFRGGPKILKNLANEEGAVGNLGVVVEGVNGLLLVQIQVWGPVNSAPTIGYSATLPYEGLSVYYIVLVYYFY